MNVADRRVALGLATLAFGVRMAFVLFYPAKPLAGGDPAVYWS